ncbi:ubiquitin-conjugating enzyme E2 Z-like [Haemaphysalis longicornis]
MDSKKVGWWERAPVEPEVPSPQCLQRARRDLKDLHEHPPPGVFAVPEEQDITKIHALVVGPLDTPYEGGFFHFLLKCPTDYPIAPPRVRLLTTDGGRVRFNPNLYANGKVCLSILGTWAGPPWSSAQSIASVLVSIQSLMNENPFHNEPIATRWPLFGSPSNYKIIIQHETIRVAVCGTVESCFLDTCPLPPALREVVLKFFLEYYDTYENIARSQRHLNGSSIKDPFSSNRCTLDYDGLVKNLQKLKHLVINRETVSTGEGLPSDGLMPGPIGM